MPEGEKKTDELTLRCVELPDQASRNSKAILNLLVVTPNARFVIGLMEFVLKANSLLKK